MFEDLIFTFKNFKTHKLRTALSILGIVIGIMAVTVITTLGSSLYGSLLYLLKNVSGASFNTLELYPEWNRETRNLAFQPDEAYRQGLYKSCDKIAHIFYSKNFFVTVLRGSANTTEASAQQNLTGIEPQYLEVSGTKLAIGHFFSRSDFAERSRKAIIDYQLAAELFPEGHAVGKKFSITFSNYNRSRTDQEQAWPRIFFLEVIGVMEKSENAYLGNQRFIYVPDTFLSGLIKDDEASSVKVYLNDENDYAEVKQTIQSYSDTYSGIKRSVYVYSPKEMQSVMDKVLGMVQIILSAIAFISLFVGGINIMNIMTATVAERKKEIGIRKAIGATNAEITVQFLIEAATITLTGGVLGVLIGFLLSYGIVNIIPPDIFDPNMPMKMQFIINRQGMLISFFVSVSVGIIFGLRPAIKAAKLDPIAALND